MYHSRLSIQLRPGNVAFDEMFAIHRVDTWAHQQLGHAATTVVRHQSAFVVPKCATGGPTVIRLTLAGGGGPEVDDGPPALFEGERLGQLLAVYDF